MNEMISIRLEFYVVKHAVEGFFHELAGKDFLGRSIGNDGRFYKRDVVTGIGKREEVVGSNNNCLASVLD